MNFENFNFIKVVKIDFSDQNFQFLTHPPFSSGLNDLENDQKCIHSFFILKILPKTSDVILSLGYFLLQQVRSLSDFV